MRLQWWGRWGGEREGHWSGEDKLRSRDGASSLYVEVRDSSFYLRHW
jgi:hypothetical protein